MTLLVLLALAAPGFARELIVTSQPADFATWAEPVRLIVRGISATACGAAAVSLEPLTSGPTGALTHTQLRERCDVSGPVLAEPFTVSVELGRLFPSLDFPGVYQLTVRDEDGSIASRSLLVGFVGTAVVEVVGPATSDRPLTLRVRDFGCDPHDRPRTVSLDEGAITVRYDKDCYYGAPNPLIFARVFDLELQTPAPFPVGSYEVRMVSRFGGGRTEVARGRIDGVVPGACQPSDTTLCLHGGRFAVNVGWRDFTGNSGVGHAWETPADDGSGLFWFFSPDNAELTIKALDGCDLNQRWWVFLASGSNVGYEVNVRDTLSGQQRTYVHEAGDLPPLLTDLETFTGCS